MPQHAADDNQVDVLIVRKLVGDVESVGNDRQAGAVLQVAGNFQGGRSGAEENGHAVLDESGCRAPNSLLLCLVFHPGHKQRARRGMIDSDGSAMCAPDFARIAQHCQITSDRCFADAEMLAQFCDSDLLSFPDQLRNLLLSITVEHSAQLIKSCGVTFIDCAQKTSQKSIIDDYFCSNHS